MDRFVKSVRHRVEVKKSEHPVEVRKEFLTTQFALLLREEETR